MQMQKIMHPRIKETHVDKRRQLYKDQQWDKYEELVRSEITRGVRLSANGHKAISQVLGIDYRLYQRSIGTYSLDLEKRDVMERFFTEVVAPTKPKSQVNTLTKEQVLPVVMQLNESQVRAYDTVLSEA